MQPDHRHDWRAPHGSKKNFSDESLIVANGGLTDNPYLVAILQAQKVRIVTGKELWPWELGQFPTDWLDAICALADARKAE